MAREIVVLLLIVFLIRTVIFGLYVVPTGSMETTMLVGERFLGDKFTPIFGSIKRGDIIAFNEPNYKYSSNTLMYLFQHYAWGPSNWTKRVIGIPGDRVRGVIENGKPEVCVNDQKLVEPYLNTYPLVKVLPEGLNWHRAQLNFTTMLHQGNIDPSTVDINRALQDQLSTRKSYDPNYSFKEQPFYRIKEALVVKGPGGKADLIHPGTLIREPKPEEKKPEGQNYWNGTDEFYVALGKNQYWCMGDNRLGSHDCRFFGPIDGKEIHAKIIWRIWSIDSNESWWILDLIKHPIDFWSRVRWGRFFQWMK